MLTKSQKISLGVLAVAALAFGVDRFVLSPADGAGPAAAASSEYAVSGNASATAKGTRASQGSPVAVQDGPGASPTPKAQTVTLANRLATIGQQRRLTQGPCGDAFRPAEAWLIALLPPPPPEPKSVPAPVVATVQAATQPTKPPKIDYAAVFTSRHALTGVMKKQRGAMAIINGRLYAKGQTIDGFKLVGVGLNEATFSGKGTTFVLRMTQPPVADAR